VKRTTPEVVILMITTTICVSVISAGIVVGIIEIVSPEKDTNEITGRITAIVNTLIGVLLGYITGRSQKGRNGNGETPP
jgi:hypothetical protein